MDLQRLSRVVLVTEIDSHTGMNIVLYREALLPCPHDHLAHIAISAMGVESRCVRTHVHSIPLSQKCCCMGALLPKAHKNVT